MNPRTFELARGVRVHKDPEDMSREELVWALRDVAGFASRSLIEAGALRKLIRKGLRGEHVE